MIFFNENTNRNCSWLKSLRFWFMSWSTCYYCFCLNDNNHVCKTNLSQSPKMNMNSMVLLHGRCRLLQQIIFFLKIDWNKIKIYILNKNENDLTSLNSFLYFFFRSNCPIWDQKAADQRQCLVRKLKIFDEHNAIVK